MAQFIEYRREASEPEIAAMRRNIEASGWRILGEPDIRRVPNEGYIIEPNAPSECDRVCFEIEAVRL